MNAFRASMWHSTLFPVALAIGVLATAPAHAVLFLYAIVDGELVFDSTDFGPHVQFTLDTDTCPWIGPASQIVIDDDGSGNPTLVAFRLDIQCTFTRDSSDSTSLAGSTVKIEIDTSIQCSGCPLAGVGDTTASIQFGSIPFAKSGTGIRCTETVTGGCASAGLTPGVWSPGPAIDAQSNLDTFVFSVGGQFLNIDVCPGGSFPGSYSCVRLTATR